MAAQALGYQLTLLVQQNQRAGQETINVGEPTLETVIANLSSTGRSPDQIMIVVAN